MKYLVFFVAIFCCISLFCQEAASRNDRKVKIGLSYTPQYCFRSLNYSAANKWVQDIRNQNELGAYGFITGLTLRKAISLRIALETGLYFTNIGGQEKKETLTWTSSNANYPVSSTTLYHFKYMNIPLKMNYFIGTGKVRYFISGGLSTSIFMSKKSTVVLTYSEGNKTSMSNTHKLGYAKMNYSTLLGLGVSFPIVKKHFMMIEPIYQQSISSIVVDKQRKEYIWTLGLQTSIFL